MVAVVSGSQLGLFNASVSGAGNATVGRFGDRVAVNSATGNLVIQATDERLSALGLDVVLVRTYNSQGLLDDDNGDNWRLGVHQKVHGLTGTVNTAGSTVKKVFGDGAEVLYRYDTTQAAYVSTDGDGAHDTLKNTSGTWTWTDGSSRNTETYNASGQLTASKDVDGNTVTYNYLGGLLTSIVDASGQTTHLDYSGNNLTKIRVVSNGVTQSLTSYAYDANRLSQVTVDLTPENSADSVVYTTLYTYDGTSQRVASIRDGDGSSVSFTYELVNGKYRVKTVTDGEGKVTTFTASQPSYSLDATKLTPPGWAGAKLRETVAGAPTSAQTSFDQSGNGLAVWVLGSDVFASIYTKSTDTWSAPTALDGTLSGAPSSAHLSASANGNALLTWVQNGNIYARRYISGVWDGASTIPVLENATAAATTPVGAINDNGRAVVAFVQSGNLYANVYNGTAWQTAATVVDDIGTANANAVTAAPSVAIDSANAAMVLWQQKIGTEANESLYFSRYNGTSWSTPNATTMETTTAAVTAPKLAFDSTGNGIAVWLQGGVLIAKTFTKSTSTWSAATTLGTGASSPHLSRSPNGNALVTWISGTNDVMARRFASGAWVGTAAEAVENATGMVSNPMGAINNAGQAAIVFLQVDGGGIANVYANRYTGSAWGAAAVAIESNANAVDSAMAPSIAIDTANNVHAVWLQKTGSETDASVYSARYEATVATAYYTVRTGDTWDSIAQTLYGASAVGNELQTFVSGGATPTVGQQLTGLPASLVDAAVQTDVTDPLGQVTSYVTDDQGRLTKVLSPAGNGTWLETRYTYDSAGNVTSITEDPTGLNRVTTFVYDQANALTTGNLLLTRDSLGNTITRTYNSNNQILTETRYVTRDPDGAGSGTASGPLTTNYVYDAENHLRFVVTPDGRVTESVYASNGQLTTTYQYVATLYTGAFTEGALVAWRDTLANKVGREVTAYTYDSVRGNVTSITRYATSDANGVEGTPSITRLVYDQRGRLLQKIDPRGEPTTADATDYRTTYTYDGLGRVLTTTQWQSATATATTTVTSYDDLNRQTKTTLANGLVTTSVYDRRGALVSVIQGTSANPSSLGTTTNTFDAVGRLRMTTDPTGVRQFFLYDEASRQVATVDGDGTLTELVYNRAGQVIKTIQYAGLLNATALATLVDGSDNPLNPTLASLRTAAGAIPSQDRITRSVYDTAGALVYTIDEAGAVTQFFYDGAGRITDQVEYATPVSVARTVDELTVVAVTTSADDRRTRNFYNGAGALVGTLDAAGYLVEFIYDSGGRLVQQVGYANQVTDSTVRLTGTLSQLRTAAGTDEETSTDPERDIRSYFYYDAQGRQVGVLDGEGYLTETQYDLAGNVKQTIRYDRVLTYNASFATVKTAASGAATQTQSFVYDGVNRLIQETNFQGTITTFSYDSVGNRLVTSRATNSAAETRATEARYDFLGRVVQELTAEGKALITGGMTQTQIDEIWSKYGIGYSYDLAGRKISATVRPNDTQTNKTLYFYDADNRLRFEVNALGERTEYRYNALNQLIDEIGYVNRISTTGLTGGLLTSGLVTTLTAGADNAKDARTTYTYALTGQIASTTTAAGVSTSFTYNAFGEQSVKLEKLDATRTLRHEYVYDTRGLLTQQKWDPTGLNLSETRAYDAFGRVTRITDPRGGITKAEYDRLGRTIATVDALSARRLTTYDAFSRTKTTVDALNNTTTYTYNDSTRTTTVTTPEGIVITTVANRHGETFTVTAAGNTTTYSYNANGQLTGASDNLGSLESRTYDRAGRQLTATDARGTVTSFTYDAANRVLTRTVDSVGGGLVLQTKYTYDGEGRVTRVEEPNGRITDTTYDRDGRVTQTAVDPAGLNLRTSYTYDLENRVVTVTEGFGSSNPKRTQYLYDLLGRRIEEIVDPTSLGGTLNLRTQYKYDQNDNVTRKIDANGNSTWFIYDAKNRLTHSIDALGSVTQTIYDAEDRVIATRRFLNVQNVSGFGDLVAVAAVSSLGTNTLDRLTQSIYDKDGRERFTIENLTATQAVVTERTFDANGNVTRSRTYAKAITVGTYTVDTALTTALTNAGNSTSTVAADDRVTWTAYDLRGRAAFTVDNTGAVVQTQYDNGDNVVQTTAFAALRSTMLATDLATLQGWATSNANAADRTARFFYDSASRLRFALDAEGYLSESRYNDAGRLETSVLYAAKPTVAANATLATVVTAAAAVANASKDQTTVRTSDVAGRVIWVVDAKSGTEERTYDALGRLLTSTDPRGYELANLDTPWAQAERARLNQVFVDTQVVKSYSIIAAGLTAADKAELRARYTTTRAYDAAGREVTVIDPLGNITRKTYDALGQQVKLTDGRGHSGFTFYDAAGRVRFQVDPLGFVTELRYNALGSVTTEVSYANALSGSYSETTTITDLLTRLGTEVATRDRKVTRLFDARRFVTEIGYEGATRYTETFKYNAFGEKTEYKDRNGGVFNYEYTAQGQLKRELTPTVDVVTNALGNPPAVQSVRIETQNDYNAFGQITVKREAVGISGQQRETRYYYDRLGQEIRVEAPALAVYNRSTNTSSSQIPTLLKAYDSAGNVIEETAPDGAKTLNYYDALNRVVASVDGEGALQELDYDAVGNIVAERRYDVKLTASLTAQSRPVPVSPDAYRETRYAHDGNNRVIETRTRVETMFSFALLQQQVQQQLPTASGYYDAPVITNTIYDANGNVVRTTDGNQNRTYHFYDAAGQRVLQVDTLGYVTRYEYTAQGQVSRETKYATALTPATFAGLTPSTLPSQVIAALAPTGEDRVTEYEYDLLGRVTRERKLSVEYATVNATNGNLTEVTGTVDTQYQYDGNGNVTAQILPGSQGRRDVSYDALGRVVNEQGAVFNAFNGRGNATVATRETTIYGYDAFGNQATEKQLGLTAAEDRLSRSQLDAAGNVRTEIDPTGAQVTYDYDINGNIIRRARVVTDVDGVAHIYRTHYTFDRSRRETSHQDTEDEGTASQVLYETFDTRYNAHGDVEAKGINGQFQEQYKYDRLGRLFYTNKENGTPRLYLYDANGNAVLEMRSIDMDLSAVSRPSDVYQIGLTNVQLTLSVYDARNQLTDVFDAPMEYGALLASPLTVNESTTQNSVLDPSLPVNAFRADYYNNRDFTAPVLTRTEAVSNPAQALQYNFGTGAPVSGVDADTFSVKWRGNFDFSASTTYRFTVTGDDGVRLFIDGEPVIDKFIDQGATTYTVDRFLMAGRHEIRLDYYDNTGFAVANLGWTTAPAPTLDNSLPVNAFRSQYFGGTDFSGVPTTRTETPAGAGMGINAQGFLFGDANGLVPIPGTQLSVHSFDSQDTDGGNYRATNAIDGDPTTMWHTQWYLANPPGPHRLDINLGSDELIGGFRYLPRQDGYTNSVIKDFAFYVSMDGVNWGTPVAQGTFNANTAEKQIIFAPVQARYVRIVELSESSGGPHASIAELNVLRATTPYTLPAGSGAFLTDTPYRSARWQGNFDFAETANYRFNVSADHGVRLYIDGRLVLDRFSARSNTPVEQGLTAGRHEVRLEYYGNYINAGVQFSWNAVPESLSNLSQRPLPNTGDLTLTNSTPRSSSATTTVISTSSLSFAAAGSLPPTTSSSVALAVPLSELGLTLGKTTIPAPDVVDTPIDVPSPDGMIRTVTERVTKKVTEIDVSVDANQMVTKTVTITTDVVTRVTVFTRHSPEESYGPNEQSLTDTSWYDKEETVTNNRSVDVKQETIQRVRNSSSSAAYIGVGSPPPGGEIFASATSINFTRTAHGGNGVSTFTMSVPAFVGYGDAPIQIEREFLSLNGTPTSYPLESFGTLPSTGGTLSVTIGFNLGSQPFRLHFKKNNQTIVISNSLGGIFGASGNVPAFSIPVPQRLHLTGQHSGATYARLQITDFEGYSYGWVGANPISIPGVGTQFIFSGANSPALIPGYYYDYEVYGYVDGVYKILNSVYGQVNSWRYNRYQGTHFNEVKQTITPVIDGIYTYNRAPQTTESIAQSNYLRNLARTLTLGAVNKNVIHRSQTYNAFGEIASQTDGRGNSETTAQTYRTEFIYNDLGQLIVERKPETDVYPEQGNAIRARPTTRNYYNELGELVGTQDANSELSATKFFSTRVLVNGRVEKEFDALGNSKRHVYDRLGNERQEFNEINRETEYQYDLAGRLTRVNRYAEPSAGGALYASDRYEYDQAGNRIAHTNALNNRETYLFDSQNRIRRARSFEGRETGYDHTYQSGIGGIGGYEVKTTTAGLSGQDIAIDRTDLFGRLRYHKDLGGHEFIYRYNQAGWLKEQSGTTGTAERANQLITYEYYGNGYLKAINDTGIKSFARFEYDLNGNRTLEAYSQVPVSGGSQSVFPYQLAYAEYDELNRVKRVSETSKFDVSYTYDAVGNRRSVTSNYYELLKGTQQHQEFYYTYDRLNRFTITMGSKNASGQIVVGREGTQVTYDALSRRQSVYSEHLDESGVIRATRERYTYDPIDTVRDADVYNVVNGVDTLAAHTYRQNNAIGERLLYEEYDGAGVLKRASTYKYDKDSLTTEEINFVDTEADNDSNPDSKERTRTTYVGNGIVQTVVSDTLKADGTPNGGAAVVTLRYDYEKWDDYKNSKVTIEAMAPKVRNWKQGSSLYEYDSNGHISKLVDSQADRTIRYVNNQAGQTIKRYEVDREANGTLKPEVIRQFYVLNGIGIGDVGTDQVASRFDYAQALAEREARTKKNKELKVFGNIADRVIPVTSADFDQNYQPINPDYPGRAPQSHIVQAGETLKGIALASFGDSSLWYVIADANGLSDPDQLVTGTRLTIPNVVTNIHNNSGTFRPFDPEATLGDTSPTLPAPPKPKPKKKGCGKLGLILVVVVAVVVTVFTAGAAAGGAGAAVAAAGGGTAAAGSTFAAGVAALSGGLASTSLAIGAAAIGGAVGSIVSQAVGIAIGQQEGFSFKNVALSAIGAGVTAGLGGLASGSGAIGSTFGSVARSNQYAFAALNGAASSVITQGIAVATGLQDRFSWKGVAIASVAAPVAKLAGTGGSRVLGASTLGSLATRTVSGIAGSYTRRAFGERVDAGSVIADAFGNAIGDSITDGIQAYGRRREVERVRGEILDKNPELADVYDRFIANGGNPGSFKTILASDRARGALSNVVGLGAEGNRLVESGVAPGDVFSQVVGAADRDGRILDIDGDIRVTGKQTFGLKTLGALNELDGAFNELQKQLPIEELVLATQLAIAGPAAFGFAALKSQAADSLVGSYINAGFDKIATLITATAHGTDVGTIESLLDRGKIESDYISKFDEYEANPNALTQAALDRAQAEQDELISLNEEVTRSKNGAKVLEAGVGILFGSLKRGEQPIGALPDNPNFVSNLPFGYKEKAFRRFVGRFDEEFKAAGFDDVSAFMQGSSASGFKYNNGNPLALDARRGIEPSDYDVAIVSPKILEKAAAENINVLNGPLTSAQISRLGLTDVQIALSKASKGEKQVNFKVYRSVEDVYNYDKTIPFSLFRD